MRDNEVEWILYHLIEGFYLVEDGEQRVSSETVYVLCRAGDFWESKATEVSTSGESIHTIHRIKRGQELSPREAAEWLLKCDYELPSELKHFEKELLANGPPARPKQESQEIPALTISENVDSHVKTPKRGRRLPGTDGPEAPYWLWWKNDKHKIGTKGYNQTWKLLAYFWDHDSALYGDLQGEGKPWPNPVSDSGISTAVNRFNNEGWPHDFPWRLSVRDREVFKVGR